MKSVKPRRPNHGWLEIKLGEDEMSHLWKCIDKKGLSHKKRLVGNISSSFELEDEDDWFHDNVISKLYEAYSAEFRNIGEDFGMKGRHPYYLNSMWVNYQKQNEFNPMHNHTGLYSFVVWMKIPTHWTDQFKLPFLRKVKESDRRVSSFEFTVPADDGSLTTYPYKMSPDIEGTMLFFPSTMFHQVYPFYNCEEDRISISGNIGIDTSVELTSI